MSIAVLDQPRTSSFVPGRRHGVYDYISPTRLNLWLKCPLAFKFRYVDEIRSPVTPALFLGKVVHAALEFFYCARQADTSVDAPEAERHIVDTWPPMVAREGMVFESIQAEADLKRQACDLVRVYLETLPPDERSPVAVETAVEAPLVDPATGEDLGIPLFGILDLVLDDPGGPLIADFKTAARGGSVLEISYEIQLSCYSYLHRHASRQVESGLEIRNLVKTKTPKVEFHRWPPREDRHFRRLFALIRAYLDSLDSGRFVFRPSWSCSSCDFCRDQCHTWRG